MTDWERTAHDWERIARAYRRVIIDAAGRDHVVVAQAIGYVLDLNVVVVEETLDVFEQVQRAWTESELRAAHGDR